MCRNVTEVESALIALASAHSSICELITLPNPTVEGRTSHAVRLGTKPAGSVDAYYLTGGVHAREWGSCEILVNLATDLCDAYSGGLARLRRQVFLCTRSKSVHGAINIIIYPMRESRRPRILPNQLTRRCGGRTATQSIAAAIRTKSA